MENNATCEPRADFFARNKGRLTLWQKFRLWRIRRRLHRRPVTIWDLSCL